MLLNTWRRWFCGFLVSPSTRHRSTSRPGLEQLEDRCVPSTFTVVNTADSGTGSLRQAILDANAAPGLDTINFRIGSGAKTISPLSALPALTGPVFLDGTSQPGFAGVPLIELTGTSAGAANGLVVSGGSSTIEGLIINRFQYFGIALQSDGNSVLGNRIGTTADGNAAAGNGFSGVFVSGNSNTIGGTVSVQRNLLSANGYHGIQLQNGAGGNKVLGNFIGTDAAGLVPLGNTYDGVAVFLGAHDNSIGTTASGGGNLISGNGRAGVSILSPGTSGNLVQNNLIGTDTNGTPHEQSGGAPTHNAIGVWLLGGATGNTIGGTASGARNVISGNQKQGVLITGTGTSGNTVAGNYIGLTPAGTDFLSNGGSGVRLEAGAANNVIGGTTSGAGNVITGNLNNGVGLTDAGTTGNVVAGNLIGLNAVVTPTLYNAASGVAIAGGAANNTIGGTVAGAGNVISGNLNNGVYLSDAGTTGNSVTGNIIGLNPGGTDVWGNGYSGVQITNGAANNTVGGTSIAARNVIGGNGHHGVEIRDAGTTGNSVQGNYLGLNAAGNASLGNTYDGVAVYLGAAGNIIGTTCGTPNIISGNGRAGVTLVSPGTSGNVVEGNLIGLDAGDSTSVPNPIGVWVVGGATSNTVGGTTAAARNVISGNAVFGVLITDAGTTGNLVQGNYVGIDGGGILPRPNGLDGVHIGAGASGNAVGGTTSGAGNVISANGRDGVRLAGTGTAGNTLAGNSIGTTAAGTMALGNAEDGVAVLDGAANNAIGGTSASARNVISGNTRDDVSLAGAGTTGNFVLGNFLGPDAAGTNGLGEGLAGVQITNGAANNSVGGTAAGAGNLISGSESRGVRIDGPGTTGNVVAGNRIGTNAAGTAYLSQHTYGVEIVQGAANNLVGGTVPGARNIISGNFEGVILSDPGTTGNVVAGNYIGTNAAGTAAIHNDARGVVIMYGASNNTVGGTAAGAGNVISGNGQVLTGVAIGGGVSLIGAGTTGNTIAGNYIGINAAGTAALGNATTGVSISGGASNNTLGGTVAGARNVIAGNGKSGVVLSDAGTTGNTIAGNYIGVRPDGVTPQGNGDNGVFISDSAAGNTIGGMAAGAGNVIANNAGDGILIGSDPAFSTITPAGTGNAVLGNSIHDNGLLGIDLGPRDGVTANDPGDSDIGPNNLQNFPVLSFATTAGGSTVVAGRLSSLASTAFRIEFFASFAGGQTFLGFENVFTDAVGGVAIGVVLPKAAASGQKITATTTNLSTMDTSEFSAALIVL
jgi:hypothetical protein